MTGLWCAPRTLDDELVEHVRWLLWHRTACTVPQCRDCSSAERIRSGLLAQIFGTVRYPEQTIAYRNDLERSRP